jgi:hypothetical protein
MKERKRRKEKAGRQANGFSLGSVFLPGRESATFPEGAPSPLGTLIYEDLLPLPL